MSGTNGTAACGTRTSGDRAGTGLPYGDTADGNNGSDTVYYNTGDTLLNCETLYLR